MERRKRKTKPTSINQVGNLFNIKSGISSPYVLYTRLIREGINYKEAANIAGLS